MKQVYLGDFKINEGIIIDNLKAINVSNVNLVKELGLNYTLSLTTDTKPTTRQAIIVDNELFLVETIRDNYDGTYDIEALPLHFILRDIIFKDVTAEKYPYVYFYGDLNKLLELITININWHFYTSTQSSFDISTMPIQVSDVFNINSSVDSSINLQQTFQNMTLMEVIKQVINLLQLQFIPRKTSLSIQSGVAFKPVFLFDIINTVNYTPSTIVNIDKVNVDNITENNLISANTLYITGGQDGLQPIDFVYPAPNIVTPNYDKVVIGNTINGIIEGKIQTNVNPKALYGYVIGQGTDTIKIEGNILGSIPLLVDGTHSVTSTNIVNVVDNASGTIESHNVFTNIKHIANSPTIIEITNLSVGANEADRISVIYFAFKSSKFIPQLKLAVVDSSNNADVMVYYNIPANVWVYLAVPYVVTYNKLLIAGIPSGVDIYLADFNQAFSAITFDSDLNAYSGWFNYNSKEFEYQIIQLTTQTNVWQMVNVNWHTCNFESDNNLSTELGVSTANKFVAEIGIDGNTTFTYNSAEQYGVIIWNNPVTYLMVKQSEGILTTFVEKLQPFISESVKTISLVLPAVDEYDSVDIGVGLQFNNEVYIVKNLSYNPVAKTSLTIRDATTFLNTLDEVIHHVETIKGLGYFTVNEIETRKDGTAVVSAPSTQQPTPPPSTIDNVPPSKPVIDYAQGLYQTILVKMIRNTEEDFAYYKVQYDIDSNFTNPAEMVTKATLFTIKDLDVEKTYYIRVKAVDLVGNESVWSDTASATTTKVNANHIYATSIGAETVDASRLAIDYIEGHNGTTKFDLNNDIIDVANGTVKLGKDATPKYYETCEIYVDVLGGLDYPEPKVYASLDGATWIEIGTTGSLEGQMTKVGLFSLQKEGTTLYLKVKTTGQDGAESGNINLYVDGSLAYTFHYSVEVGVTEEQIFSYTLPSSQSDGISISRGLLETPQIVLNSADGKILFADSYWEITDGQAIFDYYTELTMNFTNKYFDDKIIFFDIDNYVEGIRGFGLRFDFGGDTIGQIFNNDGVLSIGKYNKTTGDGPYIMLYSNSYVKISGNGLVIPSLSTAPSPISGMIYFNHTDKHFYGYNGSVWVRLD